MGNLFSADGWLNQSITDVNNILWTYVVLALLIGCALWFSFKTKFAQVRMLPEMIRLLGEGTKKDGQEHISPSAVRIRSALTFEFDFLTFNHVFRQFNLY